MTYAKPVEWQIITRQVTPQIVLAEEEPGLRMEKSNVDVTVRLIQQATNMLHDFWMRYGPDQPWPTHGLSHPFQCGYCFASPKYANTCIAWKETS